MKSIFGRTSSYRPREGRISEEDFFTEAFAGVLEHDEKLCNEIFRFFTGLNEIDFTVKVETQRSYPSVHNNGGYDRIDLELRAYRSDGSELAVILVESKISSGEGKDQLLRYAKQLDEPGGYFSDFDKKNLVYVTKYPDEDKIEYQDENTTDKSLLNNYKFKSFKPEKDFKQCQWAKIYGKVKEHVENDGNQTVLAKQLKQFMEEMNMSNEITFGDLLAMKTFNDSVPKLSSVLGEAWNGSKLSKVEKGRRMERWEDNGLFSWNYQLTEENIGIWYGFASGEHNDSPTFSFLENGMPVAFVVLRKYDKPKEYRDRILKNAEFIKLFQGDAWQIEGSPSKNIAYRYESAGEIINEDPYNDLVDYFRDRLNELETLFRE